MTNINGNGKWLTRALLGLFVAAVIWAYNDVRGDASSADSLSRAHDAMQDTSIARLNMQTALDRQANASAHKAIDHNVQLILDALNVPKYRRAYIDTTSKGDTAQW